MLAGPLGAGVGVGVLVGTTVIGVRVGAVVGVSVGLVVGVPVGLAGTSVGVSPGFGVGVSASGVPVRAAGCVGAGPTVEVPLTPGDYFKEIAEALELTLSTVKRDLLLGEAFLARALASQPRE